jgi:hypothetical protein
MRDGKSVTRLRVRSWEAPGRSGTSLAELADALSEGTPGFAEENPVRYYGVMATVFAVTVRMLKKDPSHDPGNKQTRECPFSATCTDATGEHHTFLMLGVSAQDVRDRLTARSEGGMGLGWRVTRVEEARWMSWGPQ